MPREKRPCIRCRKSFWSTDRKANQICNACKVANAKLSLREGKRGAKITSDLSLGESAPPKPPETRE